MLFRSPSTIDLKEKQIVLFIAIRISASMVGCSQRGDSGRFLTTLRGMADIALDSGAQAPLMICVPMPGWRNGRRFRLKIEFPKGSAGSSPAPGTISSSPDCAKMHDSCRTREQLRFRCVLLCEVAYCDKGENQRSVGRTTLDGFVCRTMCFGRQISD